MSSACHKLPLFVDGELPPEEVRQFTRHLVACPDCPAALSQLLVLDDLMAEGEAAQQGSPAADPRTNHTQQGATEPPPVKPAPGTGRLRRWFYPMFAGLGLAVAGVAALVIAWPGGGSRTDVLLASLAEAPFRSQQARMSHPAADRHRPFNALRAGGEPGAARAPASLETLAALERQGDAPALAAAYFLLGMPAQAAAHLATGDQSADRLNDRAAVLLEQGQADRAAPLLQRALQLAPSHRQARWNQALVLRAQGDRAGAARLFEALAAAEEGPWADEARAQAQDLVP